MKTTVIFHSNDYDGIFCREIARKFLPDAELIGWDFADKPLEIPDCDVLYVMDLPLDRPFGFVWDKEHHSHRYFKGEVIWIDHHKSSIESHPKDIPGYRIDGVAACRLAWQWFSMSLSELLNSRNGKFPEKQDFIDRKVSEPMAVRLAGEYDIWDHRGDGDLEFQFGLDCDPNLRWDKLLSAKSFDGEDGIYVFSLKIAGEAAMQCYKKRDGDIMRSRSFKLQWEGLTFLALNTPRCNSNTFAALDKPETGHDALMAFFYNGEKWTVSLYHAAHRKDIDLSEIAKRMGGGGHRGACGFTANWLPFLLKD